MDARSNVVRPAPDFRWVDAARKTQSVKKFRGQPLVLLIAPSPTLRKFRSQIGQIQKAYERLGATQTIFVAAFTQDDTSRIKTNIPFVRAIDGPAVAAAYMANLGSAANTTTAIAVIGRDGNLDYIGTKVLTGQRILDIIDNSYVSQEKLRKG
ncbi:MAG: redoxin family protein, partial [Chthoniobacterales bacterium]